MNPLPRVLFVCVENSNRSQMADAFAKLHGADVVESFSAGSKPSGVINPRAVAAMRERGYDLSLHTSKSLHDVPQGPYAFVVTMGCGDACPWIPAAHREDWDLADPKHMSDADLAKVRDDIERRVLALLQRIKTDVT
ncbi:MAG TPA: arsenate reductase ArsC [Gemmatimonadaceae bacterium]